MKRWIRSSEGQLQVSVSSLHPGSTVREIDEQEFKTVSSIVNIGKGCYNVVFDDGSEGVYDSQDKFVLQNILGSDDVDDAWESYDPFNGRKYCIHGGYSDTKYTDYPKNAIEYWFKMQKKNPADVMILAKRRADALDLVDYAANNEGYVRSLNDRYPTPYKIDYIIDECIKKSQDGCKWFHEGPYGDSIHPFGVG